MSEQRVAFGLVGCGRIGAFADDRVRSWPVHGVWLPYSHAASIRATDGADLVAVCDVDERAATEAATRYQVQKTFTDVRQMLSTVALDAIAVATRTGDRVAVLDAALDAGVRGIYCEKPLARTLEDTDRIGARIMEAKVPFVYGTKRRFMPAYSHAREHVNKGDIGPISSIVIHFGKAGLLWAHPHSVDLACFFASDSEVAYVQADLDIPRDAISSDGRSIDADPVVRAAHIRFQNDISAYIVAAESMDVELCGSAGRLTVRSDGFSSQWRMPRAEGDVWLTSDRVELTPPGTSGTVNGLSALCRAIRSGGRPDYDVTLAQRNQEILFAMVESHFLGGARVTLPVRRSGLTVTGRVGERCA